MMTSFCFPITAPPCWRGVRSLPPEWPGARRGQSPWTTPPLDGGCCRCPPSSAGWWPWRPRGSERSGAPSRWPSRPRCRGQNRSGSRTRSRGGRLNPARWRPPARWAGSLQPPGGGGHRWPPVPRPSPARSRSGRCRACCQGPGAGPDRGRGRHLPPCGDRRCADRRWPWAWAWSRRGSLSDPACDQKSRCRFQSGCRRSCLNPRPPGCGSPWCSAQPRPLVLWRAADHGLRASRDLAGGSEYRQCPCSRRAADRSGDRQSRRSWQSRCGPRRDTPSPGQGGACGNCNRRWGSGGRSALFPSSPLAIRRGASSGRGAAGSFPAAGWRCPAHPGWSPSPARNPRPAARAAPGSPWVRSAAWRGCLPACRSPALQSGCRRGR